MDSGSLVFVEASSSLSQPPDSDSGNPSYELSLRSLFDSILDVLSSTSRRASTEVLSERLVILDDVSTLEWIGFSFLDVCRFVRALVAACRRVSRQFFGKKKSRSSCIDAFPYFFFKENATLIVRHHLVLPEVDDLFRRLLQISTYHLEVRSLSSGRSGTVSGEVSRHRF